MRRTLEQRIADIIAERALVDAAGVYNGSELAKAILAAIYRDRRK